MAASKRDLKNFREFPGSVDDSGYYLFPTLWIVDSKKRLRSWQILIRLIKSDSERITGIDWNELEETQIDIIDDYYDSVYENSAADLEGSMAQMWTVTGIEGGKMTKSAPTYFDSPLNKGKKNERNVFQTALIKARNEWIKRKEKGSCETVELAKKKFADENKDSDGNDDDGNEDSSKKDKKGKDKINKDNEDSSKKDKEDSSKKDKDKEDSDKKDIGGTYFPMLAVDSGIKMSDEVKDSSEVKAGDIDIQFPAYVQPKLDGIRCIMYLRFSKSSDETENKEESCIIAYSRTKKEIHTVEYIKEQVKSSLESMYRDDVSLYLDGELYLHGKKLQDISGDTRKDKDEKKDGKNKTKKKGSVDTRNEYHIYDCFYPDKLDMMFEERHKLLLSVYDKIRDNNVSDSNQKLREDKVKDEIKKSDLYVKLVPTDEVKNMNELIKVYKKYRADKYEGMMVRYSTGKYLTSKYKTGTFLRSKELLKIKPTFTDEFEIVDYTSGKKGKDKDAIIWICTIKPGSSDEKYLFNVVPKSVDYDERRKLLEDANKNFKKKYKNAKLTVEYQDLSKDKIPQRAKSIGIRSE